MGAWPSPLPIQRTGRLRTACAQQRLSSMVLDHVLIGVVLAAVVAVVIGVMQTSVRGEPRTKQPGLTCCELRGEEGKEE